MGHKLVTTTQRSAHMDDRETKGGLRKSSDLTPAAVDNMVAITGTECNTNTSQTAM